MNKRPRKKQDIPTSEGNANDKPVVGKRYLHVNGIFIRHIDAIEGDVIVYHDQHGPGRCSRKVFLKTCPLLATPEDVIQAEKAMKEIEQITQGNDFTLRDEANALTAFAFRNGFLEDLHAGKSSPLLEQPGLSRISDDEMKRLMIEASSKLEQMLRLKLEDPARYELLLRNYGKIYCRAWNRE